MSTTKIIEAPQSTNRLQIEKKGYQRTLDMNQRGIFTKKQIRRLILKFLDTHSDTYYHLEDPKDHIDVMVSAQVLLPLLPWFMDFPKIRCKIDFLPKRKSVVTGHKQSVSALSDADVIAISRIKFLTADLTIHIYDQLSDGTYLTRKAGAPMRTICLDEMPAPYKGFQMGPPLIAIAKERMRVPAHELPDALGPIDVVYTWVDSEDPIWQARFAERVGKPSQSTAASELRYLSRDELRYSLRSIKKYAPWVRNIYIVTDDQIPDWFVGDSRVKVVTHNEIFPDPSVLPVFNSHAIESCLHRIDGLAEHFLYFNDDVFLGKPVRPTDFFNERGDVMLFFSPRLSFNEHWIARGNLPTDAAFRNTIDIIEGRFGFTPTSKVMHTPHPMRKSVLEIIENENADKIAQTRSAFIRSETDINVTGNLAYYYSLGFGVGVAPVRSADLYKYFDTGRKVDLKRMWGLFKVPVKLFCLNLTFYEEVSLQRQALFLDLFFKLKFWRRAGHERSLLASLKHRFSSSQTS